MHEVKTGLVRINLRAFLLHVVTEHFAQRLVQQVSGRMIAHDARPGQQIDLGGNAVAHRNGPGFDQAVMTENRGLDLLRVLDCKDAMHRLQHARIAHLTAGLGIKRRVVEHDDTHFPLI